MNRKPSITLRRRTALQVALLAAVVPLAVFAVVLAARSFTVTKADAAVVNTAPATRTYYIAADLVDWNYTPAGKNLITGQPFGDTENTFVANGPDRIGSTYRKALYREYTDATFTRLKPRPASESYLGILGPVIRAQVGDNIRVVFRNNSDRPQSVHPHGVLYDKAGEGAPYSDGTTIKGDDEVAPGTTYTYNWKVPERAGPGPMDPSSVMWMYHSHTSEVADTYAGLMGPIIISRAGSARADGSPSDVDREIIQVFFVSDENQSPYLDWNIAHFTGNPASVDPASDGFIESNKMHSINGYSFGNQPMITLKQGQRVRWYTMGMGTEVDLHTPHWHGNVLTSAGMRTDVVSLLPGSMNTADMLTDNPGIWLLHCHVNDHITAGMATRYAVVPAA